MAEVIELDTFGGAHIATVCQKASALAIRESKDVHFEFNGTHVVVRPNETAEAVESRWQTDYHAAAKAYAEHPQRLVEKAEREQREHKERTAVMVDTAQSETEMRLAEVPWPKTEKQLTEYIASLVNRQHDYGTCVYAVSMASVAAFHYVAGLLGTTGFQAGCADMDMLRRTRGIDGPFMLIKGEDALYPQYDLQGRLAESLREWQPWLKEQAQKKLAEAGKAHPDVVRHWKEIAKERE